MRPRGFTLVEALATLALIGIVVPAVLGAVSVANRAAGVATHRVEAVLLAEAKLEEIRATRSWEDGAAEGDFATNAAGDLIAAEESAEGAYRWELTVEDGPDLTLQQLRLRVIWEQRGQEREVELVTLVAEGGSG